MAMLVLLALVAAANGFSPRDDQPNLMEVAQSMNLTRFVEAAKQAGIDRIIDHYQPGHFTVFAPTNEAFEHEKKYPNEAPLKEKMQFHVGTGFFLKKDIVDEATIKSHLSKRPIRFNIYPNKQITANGRPIVSTDHQGRNGVIHVISEVMSSVYARQGSVVSELEECCPQHSDLLDLVKTSGLYGMLDETGPYTFLAPTNGAFDKLHPDFIIHLKKNLTALRTFTLGHVIPLTWYSAGLEDGQVVKTAAGNQLKVRVGDEVTIGKATVSLADVTAGNGVVHVIDEVLFPEDDLDEVVGNDVGFGKKRKIDLYDSIKADPQLSLFADFLDESHLGIFLKDDQFTYTVLAPTNEAMTKLYESGLSRQRISKRLVSHFISDSHSIVDLLKEGIVRTLGGRKIKIRANGENVTVNKAAVISKDLPATNGVLHLVSGTF